MLSVCMNQLAGIQLELESPVDYEHTKYGCLYVYDIDVFPSREVLRVAVNRNDLICGEIVACKQAIHASTLEELKEKVLLALYNEHDNESDNVEAIVSYMHHNNGDYSDPFCALRPALHDTTMYIVESLLEVGGHKQAAEFLDALEASYYASTFNEMMNSLESANKEYPNFFKELHTTYRVGN